MAFADLPVFDMLKTRMHWLEGRQKLLAENVANANTPGYRTRDLKALDFPALLAGGATDAVAPVRTDPMHIAATTGGDTRFGNRKPQTFETTPDGNSVDVEDEMMKLAETQQDYQLATTLYGKSLDLLKMAAK